MVHNEEISREALRNGSKKLGNFSLGMRAVIRYNHIKFKIREWMHDAHYDQTGANR